VDLGAEFLGDLADRLARAGLRHDAVVVLPRGGNCAGEVGADGLVPTDCAVMAQAEDFGLQASRSMERRYAA
jgi:hypothetical protein